MKEEWNDITPAFGAYEVQAAVDGNIRHRPNHGAEAPIAKKGHRAALPGSPMRAAHALHRFIKPEDQRKLKLKSKLAFNQ